jgi:signal transduction histidine kinase
MANYTQLITRILESHHQFLVEDWISLYLNHNEILDQSTLFSKPEWINRLLTVIEQLLINNDMLPAQILMDEFAFEQVAAGKSVEDGLDALFLGKQALLKYVLNNAKDEISLFASLPTADLVFNRLAVVYFQSYLDQSQRKSSKKVDMVADSNSTPLPTTYAGLEVHTVLKEMVLTLMNSINASQAFVYLKGKNEDTFYPFFSLGPLTVVDKQSFNMQPVNLENAQWLGSLFIEQEPMQIYPEEAMQVPLNLFRTLEMNSALILPISTQNQHLGFMVFAKSKTEEGRSFVSDQVHLAHTISHSMALALENELLYEEKKKRLAETDGLRQITFALLQKLNLEEVLEIVCAEARRLTAAQGSSVYLLHDEQWLHLAHHKGEQSTQNQKWLAVNDSQQGFAVLQKKPVIEALPVSEGLETFLLALPLQINNEIVGVLDVVKKHYQFTNDDIRIIKLFAAQATIAIENARIYQQSEQLAIWQERQRLARNLHDSVNQAVFGITLYAKAALRHLDAGKYDKLKQNLLDLTDTAKESLAEMRMLVHELHPPMIEQHGLVSAIENRLKTVEERVGIRCTFVADDHLEIPLFVEEELYRIVQEGLNNILKHSNAEEVRIILTQKDHQVQLIIEDNGVGFDLDRKMQIEGYVGLKSMRERAQNIDAIFDITTQLGGGTKISIKVGV